MRPTITEQLTGIAEILRTQIAPVVSDPLARSQLDSLVRSLESVAASWGDAVGALIEENEAIVALFEAVIPLLAEEPDPHVASLVGQLRSHQAIRPSGVEASEVRFVPLHGENTRLRGLLSLLIVTLAAVEVKSPGLRAVHDRVREHLRAGVARRLASTEGPA